MNLKRRHAWVLAVPGSLLATALAGCKAGVPDTLKIGVLGPMTGPYGLRGKDLLDGAQLAAEEVNATGFKIGGKPMKIEIIGMDDKADASVAKTGAQSLLDSGVHAVIGPLLTPQAAAVIPLFAAKGIPQLFTATAAHLHTLGKGNTFRLQANDALQGRAMAVFAYDNLQGQRIVTVVESGDYGQGLNKAFTGAMKSASKQVALSIEVDGKADVNPTMAGKIKAARADVVVLLAREPQLRSLFKSLEGVSYTDVTVLGSNVIRNKNVAAAAVPVRALFAAATAFDAEEFPSGQTFLNAFATKYKGEPVWGAHYAYDAVFALIDAVRRAESVTADKLVAKLKTIDPMTRVNQQMRFNADGELVYPSVAIYKAERGLWAAQMRSSAW
jgi:branched-chain amino acid transport system substrate-binding protein